MRTTERPRSRTLVPALLLCALTAFCSAPDNTGRGGSGRDGSSDPSPPPPPSPGDATPFKWPAGESADIDREIAPPSAVGERVGLAAAVLIDVSGSMAGTPRGTSEQKIVSARKAR